MVLACADTSLLRQKIIIKINGAFHRSQERNSGALTRQKIFVHALYDFQPNLGNKNAYTFGRRRQTYSRITKEKANRKSSTHIDYRCEDRKEVGELRGDIGAIR